MPTRAAAFATMLLVIMLGLPCVVRADELEDVTRLFRSGNATQAMNRADTFLAQKPRDPRMRFFKGVMLMEQRQTAQAQTIFEQLTQDYPELPEPYNNLAVLYAAQGDFGKARVSLEMVVRANPNFPVAYENLGDVYLKLAAQAYSSAQSLGGPTRSIAPKLTAITQLLGSSSASNDAAGAKPESGDPK